MEKPIFDCGDNSCYFAPRPMSGMRTNRGCRCLDGSHRQQVKRLIDWLEQENAELKKRVEELEGVRQSYYDELEKCIKAEQRAEKAEADLAELREKVAIALNLYPDLEKVLEEG